MCGACRCTAHSARPEPRSGRRRAGSARTGSSPGAWIPEVRYDFAGPSWFPSVREEVRATREGVALYDLTTYAKFTVEGPNALDGLQRLATSDLDVDPGRIVYTLLCNERGGIEMDPTITRLAEDASSSSRRPSPSDGRRRCSGAGYQRTWW